MRKTSLALAVAASTLGLSQVAFADLVGDTKVSLEARNFYYNRDFREDAVLTQLEEALGEREVGLVLSDMAPNMSGVAVMDQARVMHLAELGLDFSRAHLKPEGAFLVKVFQGRDYEAFVRAMRETFQNVVVRKPDASRDRSAEVYLLGRGLR